MIFVVAKILLCVLSLLILMIDDNHTCSSNLYGLMHLVLFSTLLEASMFRTWTVFKPVLHHSRSNGYKCARRVGKQRRTWGGVKYGKILENLLDKMPDSGRGGQEVLQGRFIHLGVINQLKWYLVLCFTVTYSHVSPLVTNKGKPLNNLLCLICVLTVHTHT